MEKESCNEKRLVQQVRQMREDLSGYAETSPPACGILDIVYDYDYIRRGVYQGLAPAGADHVALPELPGRETTAPRPCGWAGSPLYEEPRLAEQLDLKRLWSMDDGQNPTASLKDRASAMAVAKPKRPGPKVIACSSTGNAASSLAGNAAAAGLKTFIFVPSRAPKGKVAQLMTFGATVISVEAVMKRPLS